MKDGALPGFTRNIADGFTNNPYFPNPPVSPAALTALCDTYVTALAARKTGGPLATLAKRAARHALLLALRALAKHTEDNGGQNAAVMVSTHFSLMRTTHLRTGLDVPRILAHAYTETTTLWLTFQGVRNARYYEFEASEDGVNWFHAGTSTRTRKALVKHLVPGKLYQIRVRAVGGLHNYSGWSDPITCRAI
jgi:hypothetical protein